MDPVFKKTQTVNLVVTNDCLTDELTVDVDIDDYIYYINEDTETDVWA